MSKRIRLGVAVNNPEVSNWKNELLNRIAEENHGSVVALLLPNGEAMPDKYGFSLWRTHIRLDTWHFSPQPDAFEATNGKALKELKTLDWNDNTAIKEIDLDIVIWLSDQVVPKEIYSNLGLGVFCFSNNNDCRTNEQFLGYWEFMYFKEVLTSSLVLRTNKDQSCQRIYQTWSMMPSLSISRSRNEHMWKLVSLVPRALKEIHTIGVPAFLEKIAQNNKEKTATIAVREQLPSTFEAAVNLVKHFYRMAYKVLRKMAFREQWILMLNINQSASIAFKDFKKILPPKDRFWADPFLVEKDEKQYLFFEELPFATDKGHLSVMEIDKHGGLSPTVKILDKPYHLSYPFIFELEGRHYMIPESYEDKSVQLYECMEFPHHWEHKMNLMSGISAFDTTLYFHNGKWWLFTVISEQAGSGHNDELFLFFSDTPFTKDWKSHPQNPIVSDVRLARPAGNIYEQDGKLIRPSQDCARKYGYGFNLNEIEVMTETEYREQRILNVRPDWDKSLSRTHSFNHSPGGLTVIDAVIQRSRFF